MQYIHFYELHAWVRKVLSEGRQHWDFFLVDGGGGGEIIQIPL